MGRRYSFILFHRIVPSGCADVVVSNSDAAAQNAEKQNAEKRKNKEAETDEQSVEEKNVEKKNPEKPVAGSEKPDKLMNTSYIFSRYSMKK